MFKLYRVDDNEFIYVSKEETFQGNRSEMIRFLLNIGIESEQIEIGMVDMTIKDNHIADYGLRGSFIYSLKVA